MRSGVGLKKEEILTTHKWRDLKDVTISKMIRQGDKYCKIPPGDPRTDKETEERTIAAKNWEGEETGN